MMSQIIKLPSPNYNSRPKGEEDISALVLHYTGMKDVKEVKQRLCCSDAGVSAHYLIDEDGAIFQMVDEVNRAWHAGISSWRGRTNVNDYSIGVEIQNLGHEWGYAPFPKIQMQSVITLSKQIISRHNIESRNIIAHSDIAPSRKQDPGELFDWSWVGGGNSIASNNKYINGVGGDSIFSASSVQQLLAKYGYLIQNTGEWDTQTGLVITAFQRHFRQDNIDGIWDNECQFILDLLVNNQYFCNS